MDVLLRDLRLAARQAAANPGSSAVAILALALGIGANTAVFSVFDAVFLRPLPHYRDAGRIIQIWGASPAKGVPFHALTYADVVDIRGQSRSFDAVAAVAPGSANLTGFAAGGDEPERVAAWRVNAGFFPLIGTGFLRGRGFLPEEDRAGAGHAAVLSYPLWRRRFGGDAGVVGRTILLDGTGYVVTGVLPAGFTLPGSAIDVYIPFALAEARQERSPSAHAVARLKPGVSAAQAQADLDAVLHRLQQESNVETGALRLWGLRDFAVRDLRASATVLAGAVALVLLIACANVANLMLARGASRQREMAVRMALGASRGRLAAQLLAESAVLAGVGGALGIAAAYSGVALLPRVIPDRMPLVDSAAIDARVLAFTLGLALLTTVLAGIAPAVMASRGPGLHEGLKQGARGSEGAAGGRLRRTLVVAEVSLALMLLAGAGLLIRSFAVLTGVRPGFNPAGVLTASITLPESRYATLPAREAFFRQLLAKLETTPGVEAAGIMSLVPLTGSNNGVAVFVEGRPAPRRGELPIAWYRVVSPGYFRALEIPLRAGRLLDAHDSRDAPPVVLVNETMARRFWPGENAVGRRFSLDPPRPGRPRTFITVAGVVGDLHHRGLAQPPDAEVFFPYTQPPFPPGAHVAVRTSADPARFATVLRALVREVDRDLPVSQVRTLEGIVAASLATPRLSMLVLGLFAGIALLLAAAGIYGMISFTVARRTREIGVRMALGAMPGQVLRAVVGQALRLAAGGIVIGGAGALALARVLRNLLFGVSPSDPLVFTGVAAILAAVAAAASWIPARRAAALDPLAALREE